MLKLLRNKKTQKQIYIVLAVTVVIGFVISGVMIGSDGAKVPSTLGKIGNRSISLKDYLASYRAVSHDALLFYGEKMAQARQFLNLKGEAWDRILLLDHAKKESIKVKDEEVVQWLLAQEAFVTQGKFDNRVYENFVRERLRIGPRDFEEEIRQRLTIAKIFEKTRSKISVTEEDLKNAYTREYGERAIQYVAIPWESEKDKVTITDQDIEQIYPIVKDKLTEGEKPLSSQEAKESLKVTMLKQKATEEAVKKLKTIEEKLKGADFEKTLTAEGLTFQRFDKFNKNADVPGLGAAESFAQAIASLKKDEISQVLQVPTGAAIIKVVGEPIFDDKKFESEKDDFKTQLVEEKSKQEIQNLVLKLRNKLNLNMEAMRQLFPEDEQKPVAS